MFGISILCHLSLLIQFRMSSNFCDQRAIDPLSRFCLRFCYYVNARFVLIIGNGGPLEAGGESHAAAGGDGQAGDGRHGVFYKYTVRLLYVVSQFTWSADNIMIKIGFIIITCFQVVKSNLYFDSTYGVINAFLKQS